MNNQKITLFNDIKNRLYVDQSSGVDDAMLLEATKESFYNKTKKLSSSWSTYDVLFVISPRGARSTMTMA
jgi:hypothetical protein